MQPDIITGPGAWTGPEIQHDESWIYRVDAAAVAEIEAALAHAKSLGARIPFAAGAFPLPRFAAALDNVLEEIENGRGFMLLRGIPRSRYTEDECALIYWGLGVHLGNPVSQNARGHRLGHVRDEGRDIANQPGLMLSMDFQEGDIQLINNHITLHAREAFEDHDEPGRQRHLLRLWIAVSDERCRPLSDALASRYRWVRESGIPVKAAKHATE